MYVYGASAVAQMVKNLSAMQETRVQALGWEDPLEKRMSTWYVCVYVCMYVYHLPILYN